MLTIRQVYQVKSSIEFKIQMSIPHRTISIKISNFTTH